MSHTKEEAVAHLRPEDERVHRVELLISYLLRTGVVTSLAVVLAGILLSFIHHAAYLSSPAELQRLTRPGAAFPHTLPQVVHGLRELRGQAVIMLGLLLLIATPVLRVAVSILVFVFQRDWVFVAITTIVLLVLIASFLLGKATG